MGSAQLQSFDKRLRRINRRHRKLARGFVTSVNPDGLVVARPSRELGFPWRGLLMVLVVMMIFKGFLFAQLGETGYQSTVARLQQGNVVEQVGGFVMKADPVTLWISAQIGSLAR